MSIENHIIQNNTTYVSAPAGHGIYSGNSSLPTVGEIIQGTVTDVHGNQLSILLDNGDIFSGQLPNALNYNIGQKAQFQITSSRDQVIYMKTLPEQKDLMEDATLTKALDEAGLPKSERNLTIVKTLMDNQMSISKQSIQNNIRLCANFPEHDPANVITANKLNLPLTEQTLTQFEHYQQNSHQLLYKADQVFEQLSEAVEQNNEPVLRNLLDTLVKQLPENETTAPTLPAATSNTNTNTNTLPSDTVEQLRSAIKDSSLPDELKQLPLKELLTQLPAEHATTLLSTPAVSHAVKEAFIQQFTLTPNMLNHKENVDELYKKMDKTLTELSHLVQSAKEDTAVAKVKDSVTDMRDNLSFMKTLNETFTYLQLPIHLNDKNFHSDLYVMSKKKDNNKNPDAPIKVLLHLDMDHLGSLDIHITKEKTNISTIFYVSDKASGDLIQTNIEWLKDTINEQGFSFTSECIQKEKEIDIVKDFMEQNTPATSIKRYNFDLRA